MTATETERWPDGRPKRVTNMAAWNGDKPLVEPAEDVAIGVGDLVAMRTPVDQKGDPAIRGVVLDVRSSDDGEKVLCMAREVRRGDDGGTAGKLEFIYEEHPAIDVDPAWHIASSVFDRSRTWSAAGKIFIAVGNRHWRGASWDRGDRLLAAGALMLTELPYTPVRSPHADQDAPHDSSADEASSWEENRG